MRTVLLLLLATLTALAPAARAQETVFAAASLQDALRELRQAWAARGNPAPRLSFAASSALARQIEQGAPADLFMSADEAWMDYLENHGLIVPESRTSPLGNALVLVAPSSTAPALPLAHGTDLSSLLGPRGRLAVGDPAHVPAGRYAQAALTWLRQWPALESRLVRADNVRAALLLVQRAEAPLGVVYATDIRGIADVAVIGVFPAQSHPPITYPFALTRRAENNQPARALLAFLAGPEAAPTWQRFGFTLAR